MEASSAQYSYFPLQQQLIPKDIPSSSHQQNHATQHSPADVQFTSPNSHDIQSFMKSSGCGVMVGSGGEGSGNLTQSPEPHKVKKYIGDELSPPRMGQSSECVLQDFKTPINMHTVANVSGKLQHLINNPQNNTNSNLYQSQYQEFPKSQMQENGKGPQNQNQIQHKAPSSSQINVFQKQQPVFHNAQFNNFQSTQHSSIGGKAGDNFDLPLQQNYKQQAPAQITPQKKNSHQNAAKSQIQPALQQNKNNFEYQETKPSASQKQNLINSLDLEKLRQMMRSQFGQYSNEEIDAYLQKFLSQYFIKMQQQQIEQEQEGDQQNLDDMFTSNGAQEDSDNDEDSDPELLSQDFEEDEDRQDPSRDSLNTNLNWDDKEEVKNYCIKQMKIQKERNFRPSQYFGAIKVEQLADGIDDSRIEELFSEVFGIKADRRKKKNKRGAITVVHHPLSSNDQISQLQQIKQQQISAAANYQQQLLSQALFNNQHSQSNNQDFNQQSVASAHQQQAPSSVNPNDSSCKIVLNIMQCQHYSDCEIQQNSIYITNQNQVDNFNQHSQVTSNGQTCCGRQQMEDNQAKVIYEKQPLKKQQSKQIQQNMQVLAQETDHSTLNKHQMGVLQSNQLGQKQKSLQIEGNNFKKYMSPAELQQLGHQKATSESIIDLQGNDFQNACFKTDDNRGIKPHPASAKNMPGSAKSYQTQVSSPQSISTINKHIYNQSIMSGNGLGVNQSLQSLNYQSSVGNLNSTQGLSKSKHQSNMSMNKQAYKSIIYKHQNSNFHSISSQQSLDLKPKQNKLSYLVAKNLPDNVKSQELTHTRMNSSQTNAPKPPQNQTQPLSQKMGRDSKDSCERPCAFETQYETNYLSENSPQISPKSTIFSQISNGIAHQVNHFKLNSQTFTMQQANSTFQGNQAQPLQQSIGKDKVDSGSKTRSIQMQAQENFKKAKQSIQLASNISIQNASDLTGAQTSRSKQQKTLGRNQSQNLFLSTQNHISSVSSFLMSSNNDISKIKSKEKSSNGKVLYLDTEEISTSPKLLGSKFDKGMLNATSRPQTAINTNFSMATGISNYMNGASNLGKPPSKLSKAGFLSHNSSAKNLKLPIKGANQTVTQTTQNSSRKQGAIINHTQIQDMDLLHSNPSTTRAANGSAQHHTKLRGKVLDFGSKERDPSLKTSGSAIPTSVKSVDRSKLKSSLIQQQYEQDLASIERKKQLINQYQKQGSHKNIADSLKSSQNKGQKEDKKSIGRNQSGMSRGKSANQMNELIYSFNNAASTNSRPEGHKSDSSNRMALKITKSIEKISQQAKTATSYSKPNLSINTVDVSKVNPSQMGLSGISSPSNQYLVSKALNFPQSTKSSHGNPLMSAVNQVYDLKQQLSSYQTYKMSHNASRQGGEKENIIMSGCSTTSIGEHLRNLKSQKSSVLSSSGQAQSHQQNSSKNRKDNPTTNAAVEQSLKGQKSVEQFKRYLTQGQISAQQSRFK